MVPKHLLHEGVPEIDRSTFPMNGLELTELRRLFDQLLKSTIFSFRKPRDPFLLCAEKPLNGHQKPS